MGEKLDEAALARALAQLSPAPLLVRRVAHQFTRLMDAELATQGTSLARFLVLLAIGADPGIHGSALAAATLQSPQALGEIATALEYEGLLRRQAAGRRITHQLTDEGRDVVNRATSMLTRLQEAVLGGLDAEELAALERSLSTIEERVRQIQAGDHTVPGEPTGR